MSPEITGCLVPGETVAWSGKPPPYVFILRGIHHIAFGLTWPILGAFWYHGSGGISEATSAFEGIWRIVPLLSVPFMLAGLSFWFYPIRLAAQARRTRYVVTNRRAFIAELSRQKPMQLRVFSPEEMAPPQVIRRFDGLYDVLLTRRAQENPHLTPRLDAGFFGIPDGETAAQAIRQLPEHANA